MDKLRLAHEHLVFKWSSLDPDIKCSEVVASIIIEKVTLEIITKIIELLRDTMSVFGLEYTIETLDAAGCNWVSFNTMSTHTLEDILPKALVEKYPSIEFKLDCVTKDDVTKSYFIFVPDN